jgi:hypothetical protein
MSEICAPNRAKTDCFAVCFAAAFQLYLETFGDGLV